LSKKDRKTQKKGIKKSIKKYKDGKYHLRKKLKSFKSRKSPHILKARKVYGLEDIKPSHQLAIKTKCSLKGLKKIVKKGQGAYFSSGSRPNQTPHSWGYARLASAITGGNASKVDFHIIEKECNKNGKAYKLAKKKLKFKMQDQNLIRVFRDDLVDEEGNPRNFNKDDFHSNQVLQVLDIVDNWPKWDVRIKSAKNNGLEIFTEFEDTQIIPYADIREVIYKPSPKRPKSAMKKGRKYKMQGAAGGVTVTVNELGRDFNKDDFKVGQKIDIRRKLRSSTLLSSGIPSGQVWGVDWWLHTLTVVSVENSKLSCTRGNRARELERLVAAAFEQEVGRREMKIDYNSIHSVRYHEMPKRPKSAMKTGGKYKINKKKSTAKKADRHPHSRKPSIGDFVEVGDFDLSLADTFDQVSDDYYHHSGKRYTLPDGTLSSARYLAKLKGFGQSPLTGNDIFEIELVNRDDGKNAGQGTHLTYKIWFQPGPDGRWWYSDAVRRAQDPQGVGRAPPFMGVWYKYNMGENKLRAWRQMQDNAKYVIVTVNDLGRDFNKDDFNVGQIIKIRWKAPYDYWERIPCTIVKIADSRLYYKENSNVIFNVQIKNLGAIRFFQVKKRPKSAMKKGGGQVKRKSPSKKARSPRKKPLSPRKVKAAKKIQKYVRKRSGGRKNKFKMQDICKCKSAVKCRRRSKCKCKYCPY
jgi:hypothetical protein